MQRVCSVCHAVNRIPVRHLADAGLCGKCRAALPPHGAPIDVTSGAQFDEIIAGARVPVLVDFWATWCGPCLAAMPRLDQLARKHPDVSVLAINLDDAAAARALFDEHHYAMTLVADDGDASQRYGVSSIPHTVLIDRHGVVREVIRGATSDLAARVEALVAAE